jgi:sulfoacetaldehyde dehydrogenase
MARARAAQTEYETFDQRRVDDVVAAIAWTILEPERNRYLSRRAVEDTGTACSPELLQAGLRAYRISVR